MIEHGQMPQPLEYMNNDGRPRKLPRVSKTYAGKGGNLSSQRTEPNALAAGVKPSKRLRK